MIPLSLNLILLALESFLVFSLTLIFLCLGAKWLASWMNLLLIAMNLFVLEQISVLGMHLTLGNVMSVAYVLSINFLNEFFSKKEANDQIKISMIMSCVFSLLSCFQLLYKPSAQDFAHPHLKVIFLLNLRIVVASCVSFLVMQFTNLFLFNKLKNYYKSKKTSWRFFICYIVAHGIDGYLFSFLAFYGLIKPLWHIIYSVFFVKFVIVIASMPAIIFARKVRQHYYRI